MALDFLGDEMPPGYEPWSCPVCMAVCNFEAMMQCAPTRGLHPGTECGFNLEQPESNGGAFGFIIKSK